MTVKTAPRTRMKVV